MTEVFETYYRVDGLSSERELIPRGNLIQTKSSPTTDAAIYNYIFHQSTIEDDVKGGDAN